APGVHRTGDTGIHLAQRSPAAFLASSGCRPVRNRTVVELDVGRDLDLHLLDPDSLDHHAPGNPQERPDSLVDGRGPVGCGHRQTVPGRPVARGYGRTHHLLRGRWITDVDHRLLLTVAAGT